LLFLPAFFYLQKEIATGLSTIRLTPMEEIEKIWRVGIVLCVFKNNICKIIT
jgi:hypothetical protein